MYTFLDIELGQVVDQIDSDYSQTDLNNQLLINHDRKGIIESLDKRISKPYLEFLLNSTDLNDYDYWKNLLLEIAKVYSLNIAKIYAEGILSTNDFPSEVVRLLIYLKLKLINHIEQLTEVNNIRLTRSISLEDFQSFIAADKAPEVMLTCIKYIDKDSFKKFISRIFLEVSLDFME